MQVRVHKRESLKGALLLVGFPSRGFVGGVAANYVIEDLKMWHIASLYDSRFPPTVVVRDGVAYSPIQFFVSAERCGPDGKCDKLVVCLSEIPIEPELIGEVARAILGWAQTEGVSHVVVLEGMESTQPPEDGKRRRGGAVVRGVRSIASRHRMEKYVGGPFQEGVVSSYASGFLLVANELDLDLIALYIEAKADLPDAAAAAALLGSVNPLLPHLNLDPKPLAQRARQLESTMKSSHDRTGKQIGAMRRSSEFMYQ